MYPQVFLDYSKKLASYDNVSVIPTPAFWYPLQSGDEIAVEIEPGKTLVVRYLTTGEPRDDGMRTVFFELNGQPRMIRVPNRSAAAKVTGRRKVEDGQPGQLAAPMPGAVSSLAVAVGQRVEEGDVVLTLEAMKMETVLHAPLTGAVKEILVSPGTHVDAKDLLLVIESGGMPPRHEEKSL